MLSSLPFQLPGGGTPDYKRSVSNLTRASDSRRVAALPIIGQHHPPEPMTETTYTDKFTSGTSGESDYFQTSFTQSGCALRYPGGTGERLFESRQAAHAAIGARETGFAKWDALPANEAIDRAWDKDRWSRKPSTITGPLQHWHELRLTDNGSNDIPTSPPSGVKPLADSREDTEAGPT